MAKNVKRTPVVTDADEEMDFIKELADEVNGKLKRDAIMVGESAGDDGVPYWVLTGIPQLDFAVGGINHPGFPGARFIEIFGGEGAGKGHLPVTPWGQPCRGYKTRNKRKTSSRFIISRRKK